MEQTIIDKINLIKYSDDYSLNEYCKLVSKYLPFNYDLEEINDHMECADNQNLHDLFNILKKLASKKILPELKGSINIESILRSSNYEHEDYVEVNSFDGEYELFSITKNNPEGLRVNVENDSIQIVSEFQEDEVIITSTELEGNYFLAYQDKEPTILSANNDNFIKALCSLSLMSDKEVFKAILPHLPNDSIFNIHSSLETLSRIVFKGENIIDSIVGLSPQEYTILSNFYYDSK